MRNYVNTDDELKLPYELTGLAHLLSVELIQALLGCLRCRLPDPGAYGCWPSGRGLLWMGSTYFSKSPQCSRSPNNTLAVGTERAGNNAAVIVLSGHFHASGI